MKNITTSTGFEVALDDSVLNDWELLKALREIDQGDVSAIVDVSAKLLGPAEQKRLEEHCRDERGKIGIDRMVNEIKEILEGAKAGKNS